MTKKRRAKGLKELEALRQTPEPSPIEWADWLPITPQMHARLVLLARSLGSSQRALGDLLLKLGIERLALLDLEGAKRVLKAKTNVHRVDCPCEVCAQKRNATTPTKDKSKGPKGNP